MELVRELDPRPPRQIRHSMVRGRDESHYKILTLRLYDMDPPPEFHNFEVNVMKCREDGKFNELDVPYYCRFYTRENAERHHGELLENFDEILVLPEPASHGKEKKPAEKR